MLDFYMTYLSIFGYRYAALHFPHHLVKIQPIMALVSKLLKSSEANKEKTMEEIKYTKRIGHVFEHVRDIKNIKQAIQSAAKGKRERQSVKRVLENIDYYAQCIQKMLDEETFFPNIYTIKTINDGISKKVRDTTRPRFYPDQCIHHAVVQVLASIVQHSAYEYSCGCVPKKGVHYAKKAIEKWIESDPKGTTTLVQLDITKCYPSIRHEELRNKFRKKFKDTKFLRLIFRIIASFQQPMVTGERLLPEVEAVGIPVGLYTSPWFCNFFLNDLDHEIKEKMGAKHYVRYVDDMVIFDSNKKKLHKILKMIQCRLKEIGLTVKHNWQVFKLKDRALDFLGFKFYRGRTTIRKSIALRIKRKAKKISKMRYISFENASAMISYMGWIFWSDSIYFWRKHVRPYVNIKKLKGVVRNENRIKRAAVCPV